MISGRRKVCEEYTKGGQDVFSYRFDTPLVSQTSGYRSLIYGTTNADLI